MTSDNETEDGTLTERMESVGGLVLLESTVDSDPATSDGLVQFGAAHLTDSDGSGNTHDGSGNQVLCGDTHLDVRAEHGTSNRGKT